MNFVKILIVDDHQPTRDLIKKIILSLPFQTEMFECNDGIDSIKIFKDMKPDMILMDLMMKELDGLSAIRRIRLFPSETKIIVLSQLPDEEYKKESLAAGANDFLNKENLVRLPMLLEIYNKTSLKY